MKSQPENLEAAFLLYTHSLPELSSLRSPSSTPCRVSAIDMPAHLSRISGRINEISLRCLSIQGVHNNNNNNKCYDSAVPLYILITHLEFLEYKQKKMSILRSESWKNLVLLQPNMMDIFGFVHLSNGWGAGSWWLFSSHYDGQCFKPYLIHMLPYAELEVNSKPASRYFQKGPSTLCELSFQCKEILNSSFPELKLFFYHVSILVMSMIPPLM